MLLAGAAGVVLLLGLWFPRNYHSEARLWMLFWHPEGSPNIPFPLQSEADTRKELLGTVVFQRVKKRLQWSLGEQEYKAAVGLVNNRSDWSHTGGIYLQISAISSTPERARELCEVTAEEFAGRCTELAREWDETFWDLQMMRAQGALEQWRFQNKPLEDAELRERAGELSRRLQLTIAAKQMRISRLRDGERNPELSEKSQRLTEQLKELQADLDSLWLEGVSGERVTDMEVEFSERQQQLQISVRADVSAALERLETELNALQTQEETLRNLDQTMGRLNDLQRGVTAVARARELAMGEMSMFCLVTRKPRVGTLVAISWVRLLPSVVAGLLALLCVVALSRRPTLEVQPPLGHRHGVSG